MIAYNTHWLANLIVHRAAENARQQQCLTDDELKQIKEKYPAGFYTPNIFVGIGLFLLTLVISICSFGLLTLLGADMLVYSAAGMCVFFGLLALLALEWIIRSKSHYQSGVDNALLWLGAGLIFGGICFGIELSETAMCLLAFILSALAVLRYTDKVMAVVAFLSLGGVLFFSFVRMGHMAKALVPFLLMGYTAVVYFIVKKWGKKQESLHYEGCLAVLQICALLGFYAAGNYFVVRELGNALFGYTLPSDAPIPFGWLFWILTFAVPVVYLLTGIGQKNAILLRTGLLLFAAIVFTVRYYHAVMPLEQAMVLGGIVLTAVAYGLERYLRKPRHGFTSEDLRPAGAEGKIQLESLVIAETFSAQPETPATQFGGGSFGGGGASGEF